jgi:hypothetical protein
MTNDYTELHAIILEIIISTYSILLIFHTDCLYILQQLLVIAKLLEKTLLKMKEYKLKNGILLINDIEKETEKNIKRE